MNSDQSNIDNDLKKAKDFFDTDRISKKFKESACCTRYPHHVSDRVDELINELDATQIRQLYDELKKNTYSEWLKWLEGTRGKIAHYDYLTRTERKRCIQQRIDNEPLLIHHACIYIELWRQRCLLDFPPHTLLDTPESQREILLTVVTSYSVDPRDLWPFDHEEIDDSFPFRRE
ncbi:MAG: hypothetical protein D3906_01785 [Candidatus Electrothrix sp. AUS1_2]|nr:hypothetical protein [Candidatus Electrothrix sp. AUS1_2]